MYCCDVNTQRLQLVVAVEAAGSIRGAADLLDVDPSSVSRGIAALEQELGIAITEPDGRGVRVTARGAELADRARRILGDVDDLVAWAGDAAAAGQRSLRIGAFEVFSTHVMGELLERLDRPMVDLVEVVPRDLAGALERRVIDVGISMLPDAAPGITSHRVGAVESAVFGRADRFEGVPLAQLPFVAPVAVAGSLGTPVPLDGWPAGRERGIRYRVELLESALAICRRGLAVAYLPAELVAIQDAGRHARIRLQRLDGPGVAATVRRQPVHVVTRAGDGDEADAHAVASALGATLDAARAAV